MQLFQRIIMFIKNWFLYDLIKVTTIVINNGDIYNCVKRR